MNDGAFLAQLRAERETLASLIQPLECEELIKGDPKASSAALDGYKRRLDELDALIVDEALRNASCDRDMAVPGRDVSANQASP